MAESIFAESISLLSEIGLFDIIIPFMLGTAVSYGVLEETKVLGSNHRVNMIISIACGLILLLAWMNFI